MFKRPDAEESRIENGTIAPAPDIKPVICDYAQLRLLALEGASSYLKDSEYLASQTGFKKPNKSALHYAARLLEYLKHCEDRPHQAFIVLLLVFDNTSETSALLKDIIAHTLISINQTSLTMKTFKSKVFSSESLPTVFSSQSLAFDIGNQTHKKFFSDMVSNLLQESFAQYPKDDQLKIRNALKRIDQSLRSSPKNPLHALPNISFPEQKMMHSSDSPENIIIDYEKLWLLAKEGAIIYLKNGPEIAAPKGFDVPGEEDLSRAEQFLNYLVWCNQALPEDAPLINRLAILSVLLAIFETQREDVKFLAYLIAKQYIVDLSKTTRPKPCMREDSLCSEVFSKKSLSDLSEESFFDKVLDKQDRHHFHYVLNYPVVVRTFLNQALMAYSEDDRQKIQKGIQKFQQALSSTFYTIIEPRDLPGMSLDVQKPFVPYYRQHRLSALDETQSTLANTPSQRTSSLSPN